MFTWPTFSTQDSGLRRQAILVALLGACCCLAFLGCVALGPVRIPLDRLWAILVGTETSGALYHILWQVRLPRALAALLLGMALSSSGAVLQATMHNPLAAPSLLGVNAGAGLATMLLLSFWPERVLYLAPASFGGALVALLLIMLISRFTGGSTTTLILAGVAVSALLGAGIDALRLLYPDAMFGATSFMIGGFAGTTWSSLQFASGYVLVALLCTLLCGSLLNVLELGDDVAQTLGVNVRLCRPLLMVLAAVLAGGSVCLGGLIGFVGLIVPHMARQLLGSDNRWLLPGTMLLGGTLVLGCDLAARLLFAPYELPAGILLATLGGPFFIYLLYRNHRAAQGK